MQQPNSPNTPVNSYNYQRQGAKSPIQAHDHADQGKIDWDSGSSLNFWQTADQLQDEVLQRADELFSFVQDTDVRTLRTILIQYRFFTVYYISDLALLIAKLGNGKMRTFLANILSDELGNKNPTKAHPRLYDDFLASIGTGGIGQPRLAGESSAAGGSPGPVA